jgi:Fe-S cluster biogenesis protein NfuA
MKHTQKPQDLIQQIKETIESVRVYVNNDGGDISFVDYKDGIVTIKIMGNCVGCSMLNVTFDQGIKEVILVEHPEVKNVKFIV